MALDPYEYQIALVLLKSRDWMSTNEIATQMKVNWGTVSNHLESMEKRRLVHKRTGKKKTTKVHKKKMKVPIKIEWKLNRERFRIR